MTKTYKGTNKEDFRFYGINFKAGEVESMKIINEKHTFNYIDSISGALLAYDVQIQQVNIYTKDDVFSIAPPFWGYRYMDDIGYIISQTRTFKNDVKVLLSNIGINVDKLNIE